MRPLQSDRSLRQGSGMVFFSPRAADESVLAGRACDQRARAAVAGLCPYETAAAGVVSSWARSAAASLTMFFAVTVASSTLASSNSPSPPLPSAPARHIPTASRIRLW